MAKTVKTTKEQTRNCFIISPLGSDNSETRRKADALINSVLKPILQDSKFHVIAPHEIDTPGSITQQVIQYLLEADLVVANLTDLNPNVMYELAVRHAKRLPVISIAEEGTDLPFDIITERTIFYRNDLAGGESLKPRLLQAISDSQLEGEPDNPIYRAVQDSIMKEIAEKDDVLSYINKKLDDIMSQLRILRQSKRQYTLFNSFLKVNIKITPPKELDDLEMHLKMLLNQVDLDVISWSEFLKEDETLDKFDLNIEGEQVDINKFLHSLHDEGYDYEVNLY